jgi:hypothetical protein
MGALIRWTLLAAMLTGLGGCERQPDFEVAEGYVLEAETNRPIEGAFVILYWRAEKPPASWIEAEVVVRTDASGRFEHRSPTPGAYGWRLQLSVYKPGYQRFPFYEYKQNKILTTVDRHDEDGVERTPEQLIALGYQMEPENQLTFTGWVEIRPMPKWFQRSEKNGPQIIYLEKATLEMNARIQQIERLNRPPTWAKNRLGPLQEFEEQRFIEATNVICTSNEKISASTIDSIFRLYENWRFRSAQRFDIEMRQLNLRANEQRSRQRQRARVIDPPDYKVLCNTAKLALEVRSKQ